MERVSGILGRYILLLLLTFTASSLLAKTWIVDQKGKIRSVKIAINLAKSGDTVIIKSGVYNEHDIIVAKAIFLKGENFPVIDGQNAHQILTVQSDNVLIEGIEFRNSGSSSYLDISALKILKSRNVKVRGNRFKDNFFAIHSMESSNGTFIGNEIVSGGRKGMKFANGIHCWKASNMRIENNLISGHRDGIYLEFITHSIIKNNKSIGNKRYGLHFMFSHDNTYTRNQISKNGAGVAVMYSNRVVMKQNIFSGNWGNAAYGILLKEINDSVIEENRFEENTIAIFAESTNRIQMKNNQFIKNGWAIQMQSSASEVNITENNFIGNTFDVSASGNLAGNNFHSNYWDKYEGYDLNRDGFGDIPYHPISFYSVIIERNPGALMLFRSFFVKMMDKAESAIPSLTPVEVMDRNPRIKKINLVKK